MRIIAGSKARFKLIPPKDRTTRPITDRVKESLFSILQPRLQNALVADVCCGTGSLGLEALSRGARHAIMIDMDREAVKRLNQNIDHLDFRDLTTIYRINVYRSGIPHAPQHPDPVDIFFVDPPFVHFRDSAPDSKLAKLMAKLMQNAAPDALAVLRHEKRVQLPDQLSGWTRSDRRNYGSMAITFYRPDSPDHDQTPQN